MSHSNNGRFRCSSVSKYSLFFLSLTENIVEAEKSDGKELVKQIDGNKLFDKLEEIVAPIDCVSNLATLLNMADVQQFSPSLQNRVSRQFLCLRIDRSRAYGSCPVSLSPKTFNNGHNF